MKKNNLFLSIFCVILLLCTSVLPVFADDVAQEIADGIAAYQMQQSGAESVQAWIDGALTENAGITSEWYILALRQSGEGYDFSKYADSLRKYLSSNKITSASTRQKYALALLAAGGEESEIAPILADSIGQQGLMSLVFGLHLLHNTQGDFGISEEEIIGEILAQQLADGGFANAGTRADADVTAMTVQALAPHYAQYSAEIDRAVLCLSALQQGNGGYQSYGADNPESAAQVLIALCALGIDCTQDERFLKNGRTVLHGITPYRLQNGAFSHTLGESENKNATAQVFLAMQAYEMLQNGGGSLFILQKSQNPAKSSPILSLRIVLVTAVTVLGVSVCIVLWIRKKGGKMRIFAVLALTLIGAAVILLTDIQSAQEYYGEAPTPSQPCGSVTLSIRCDTVKNKGNLPKNGEILSKTKVPISQGDTVFDVLISGTRTAGIPMEFSGSEKMPYIEGISDLYEFDHGDLSGWVYHVNGASPSVGCGEYKVSSGDEIEWLYSLDLGNDVK